MEMDDLTALRLQIEWGADEALLDAPVDRLAPALPRTPASAPPAFTRPPAAAPRPLAPAGPADAAQRARAAPDLAALHAALDGFDACPLRGMASTTVAPSGNPAGGLVLVAEAPTADDDRAGTAFSGALGQTVDRVLASAGLTREALLLCHLVPWRPPGGRQPNEAEVAMCLPFLHRLLALAAPRHVVLLGGWPLRALANDAGGIRRARGRWTEVAAPGLPALPALPMLPPELWLTSPGNRQATWSDLLALLDARVPK